MNETGEVAVTLHVSASGNAQYDRWDVAGSAHASRLRLVATYRFDRAHFPGYTACDSRGRLFNFHQARTYVLSRIQTPTTSSYMYSQLLPPSLPAVPVFLCVELDLIVTVLRTGFLARSHPNVAVSKTASLEAHDAFSQHHPEKTCVTLCFLPAPELTVFSKSAGSLRIAGNIVPPNTSFGLEFTRRVLSFGRHWTVSGRAD